MKKSNSRPAKGRPALPADERKSIVVAVKFDIDSYQQMMDKALTAGLNRSEYIRQVSVKGRVVERLSPRDIKAIRDLQGRNSRQYQSDCKICQCNLQRKRKQ